MFPNYFLIPPFSPVFHPRALTITDLVSAILVITSIELNDLLCLGSFIFYIYVTHSVLYLTIICAF